MSNVTITFVKMDFLKNTPYFDMLTSKCKVYKLCDQRSHFKDEVVVEASPSKTGLIKLMVRMHGSEYFTKINQCAFHELMENARTEVVRVA